GITNTIRIVSGPHPDDILWYDLYAGMFNLRFTGESWTLGAQCYPATQANGCKVWGQPRFPGFLVFDPEPQCYTDFEPFIANGTPFRTSNPGGLPDSVRIFVGHQQQCFRFAVSLGCNTNEGGYFDNVSLAFYDDPSVEEGGFGVDVDLGAVTCDFWQLTNDTFPANETAGLPGTAAFDTTTALIGTGLNTAPETGSDLRFDIPGDSTSVG